MPMRDDYWFDGQPLKYSEVAVCECLNKFIRRKGTTEELSCPRCR